MRGIFLGANGCHDCHVSGVLPEFNNIYCDIIENEITEYSSQRTFHPDCPMQEISTVKEAVGAWLKGIGADGLIKTVLFGEKIRACCSCSIKEKDFWFMINCVNSCCRPAKYNKDGKLEAMND